MGVQTWVDYQGSFAFPERMNVTIVPQARGPPNTEFYVNPKTGQLVPDWVPPDNAEVTAALQRFLDALMPYEHMVHPGYFNFPPPNQIPEDLLMPFKDFVKKYNCSAAIPRLWDSTASGVGDTMNVPTLYALQGSGYIMARTFLGQAASGVPSSGRVAELYEKVADFLGSDVLFETMVLTTTRTARGVTLRVKNPQGKTSCIEAKRLLLAIEPTSQNLSPFDLDKTERDVFGKFKFPTSYVGFLRHPSLQNGFSYAVRTTSPESYTYLDFPTAPVVGRLYYLSGTNALYRFIAVGTEKDTSNNIKKVISKHIKDMIEAGTLPPSNGTVEYAVFADHGHMHAHVTAKELRAGFIQKLYSLQGRKNTWYTGAAWSGQFSTVLWKFNEELLPRLIQGL